MKNYKKEKLTINIQKASNFGLILFSISVLLIFTPYFLVWKNQFLNGGFLEMIRGSLIEHPIASLIIFFSALIGGIISHELIHGIVWAFYAENKFKSIRFGVLWYALTPYCHCKEPLKVYQYILGALMPGILLGILPSIIAICIGNFALLLFGIFFTISACGDFLVVDMLRRENMNDYVQDHPSEIGCFIYRKKENNNQNG